jgi:hypothetical protein
LTGRLSQARASFAKEHGKSSSSHHKILKSSKPQPEPAPKTVVKADKAEPKKAKTTPVTPERQAVNMELAQSGSAFSVSTLSQLANRQPQIEQTGPNEVTISLH